MPFHKEKTKNATVFYSWQQQIYFFRAVRQSYFPLVSAVSFNGKNANSALAYRWLEHFLC